MSRHRAAGDLEETSVGAGARQRQHNVAMGFWKKWEEEEEEKWIHGKLIGGPTVLSQPKPFKILSGEENYNRANNLKTQIT